MKTIRLSFITFLAAAMLMACTGCHEVQEHHFENLDKAKEAHMIEKGWLPSTLPVDAKQIRLKEDLDIASVYGSFTSKNGEDLKHHCSETGGSSHLPKYGPKWFPLDLREANTFVDLKIKGYDVLFCDKGEFTVAFRPSEKEIYFWSTRQ
jgi:hypothetical protein